MAALSLRTWLTILATSGLLLSCTVLHLASAADPAPVIDDDPPPAPPVSLQPSKVPPAPDAKPIHPPKLVAEPQPTPSQPPSSRTKPAATPAPAATQQPSTTPKPVDAPKASAASKANNAPLPIASPKSGTMPQATATPKPTTTPKPAETTPPAEVKAAPGATSRTLPKAEWTAPRDKTRPTNEPATKPSTATDAKPKQEPETTTPETEQKPQVATDAWLNTPQMKALQARLRYAMAYYYPKKLNNRDNDSWEIMHSIIAYGVECEIFKGGAGGTPVNAVGWLCFNGVCKGGGILHMERGRVAARKGVNVQGHPGQLLAILAQSRVPTTYPMKVDGQDFTLADLIESEKLGCDMGMELTFKLIALSHYLDLDETWTNYSGQPWSIPRLIQEELKAPIKGAACGGTHRLMGLAYAVQNRQARGQPVTGEYLRAKNFLHDYHRYTLGMQNSDGSFSTEWFNRRGARNDLERRLQTTGHILEWMSYSLSPEELRDPRIVKAVTYLTNILVDYRQQTWEIGHLGHGLHALAIYNERVFKPVEEASAVADRKPSQQPEATRRQR